MDYQFRNKDARTAQKPLNKKWSFVKNRFANQNAVKSADQNLSYGNNINEDAMVITQEELAETRRINQAKIAELERIFEI